MSHNKTYIFAEWIGGVAECEGSVKMGTVTKIYASCYLEAKKLLPNSYWSQCLIFTTDRNAEYKVETSINSFVNVTIGDNT